jgi:hypothetical protein
MILPSYRGPICQNSGTKTKNDIRYTRRRLASTDYGIPPSSLWTKQHHRVEQNATEGKRIPNHRRWLVQNIGHRTASSLCEHKWGQGIVNLDTLRYVQRSHRSKSPHCKGVQVGFLLALHNWWCIKDCQNLQGMSKVSTEYSRFISTQSAHHTLVAVVEMGYRHSRTIDNSTRKL